MKILEERLNEKIHKCSKCKSIYIYTAKDVDYSWRPTMKCPVCGNFEYPSIFDKKVNK